jgi:hypothetical protein
VIAFEMVSDTEKALALSDKITASLAHGAAEVWEMYPTQRRFWVYTKDASSARDETRTIHSDLLPGIEIPLDQIFV